MRVIFYFTSSEPLSACEVLIYSNDVSALIVFTKKTLFFSSGWVVNVTDNDVTGVRGIGGFGKRHAVTERATARRPCRACLLPYNQLRVRF